MAEYQLLLQGKTIQRLRKKRWTQAAFARFLGIGARVYSDIERGKRAVSERVALKVVSALRRVDRDITVEAITAAEFVLDGISEVDLPGLNARDREGLNHARDCDLAGNHGEAIRICERLRRRVRPGERERKLAIQVRLATFLDNAGEHEKALDELSSTEWTNCASEVLARHRAYHVAIAQRRLGRWDLAMNELAPLGEKPASNLWAGAMHQMGAICHDRSEEKDAELMDRALTFLNASRLRAQAERAHREGFSLRRIARICAARGAYADSIRYFVEAIDVFARCRCRRYVEDTRKDLEDCVLSKTTIAVGPGASPNL